LSLFARVDAPEACSFARFGRSLALICGTFALIGHILALVREAIALVGESVALVGHRLPCRNRPFTILDSPLSLLEQADPLFGQSRTHLLQPRRLSRDLRAATGDFLSPILVPPLSPECAHPFQVRAVRRESGELALDPSAAPFELGPVPVTALVPSGGGFLVVDGSLLVDALGGVVSSAGIARVVSGSTVIGLHSGSTGRCA
jgi:hypothetical protein